MSCFFSEISRNKGLDKIANRIKRKNQMKKILLATASRRVSEGIAVGH